MFYFVFYFDDQVGQKSDKEEEELIYSGSPTELIAHSRI